MEFKVGDWVKIKKEFKQIFNGNPKQIKKVNSQRVIWIDSNNFKAEELELWKPEEGEYCWFYGNLQQGASDWSSIKMGSYVFGKFERMINQTYRLASHLPYKTEMFFEADRGTHYSDYCNDNEISYIYKYCEPFIGELPSFA